MDAATLAGEALEIGRAAANVERVASSLDNLGSALIGLGRIEEAAEHFTDALRRGARDPRRRGRRLCA